MAEGRGVEGGGFNILKCLPLHFLGDQRFFRSPFPTTMPDDRQDETRRTCFAAQQRQRQQQQQQQAETAWRFCLNQACFRPEMPVQMRIWSVDLPLPIFVTSYLMEG
jgi:hypothetical protein